MVNRLVLQIRRFPDYSASPKRGRRGTFDPATRRPQTVKLRIDQTGQISPMKHWQSQWHPARAITTKLYGFFYFVQPVVTIPMAAVDETV